jgi:fatty-acyl-CoA synthase
LITPTRSGIPRKTEFALLTEALEYAAGAGTGITFYGGRGEPVTALSYRDLHDRAVERAAQLRALGFERGDRVGLIGETSPDFVTAFLACVWAGLLPVPLPVAGVFAEPARYGDQISRQLAGCGARLLLRPEGPALLAKGAATPEMSWSELAAGPAAEGEPVELRPDDLCYLQYSSGSTRFPRGVGVTHRALMRNCRDIAVEGIAVTPDERVVSWLPLYHDMGLVGTLLASLASQVSVDLITTDTFARRPMVWLQIISQNRGTVSYAPCFGYDLCRRRAKPGQIAELDLSSWRVAGVGAELIDPQVMEGFAATFATAGFRRLSILPSYGLAEATLAVTFAPLEDGLRTDTVDAEVLGRHRRAVISNAPGGRTLVRCGRPLASQSLEIRGPEGDVMPPRMVGRVMIRGESVMQGYFNDPDATSATIDAEGWLDTGDLGYMAEGELVIVGRAKDTIIVNGRNLWPQDLEWLVEQMPEVRTGDCAAFGTKEPGQGERAVLLVQCRAVHAAERGALAAEAHRIVLQATGVDCLVIPVPPHSLPRTSSGKLNRGLARERYLAGLFRLSDETALPAEAAPPRQVAAAR